MNDFCRYCTGCDVQEIRECDDKNCPFHPFRKTNLEWQDRRKIDKKGNG